MKLKKQPLCTAALCIVALFECNAFDDDLIIPAENLDRDCCVCVNSSDATDSSEENPSDFMSRIMSRITSYTTHYVEDIRSREAANLLSALEFGMHKNDETAESISTKNLFH
ncbi:MAG: hypothetical protein LBB29_03165 [Holosporaceae bacterium]|jgi:hypothetical protein|nr:hypothetical protein [Holosporaceae bacterium]